METTDAEVSEVRLPVLTGPRIEQGQGSWLGSGSDTHTPRFTSYTAKQAHGGPEVAMT
jgi:hypothetical protein